MNLRRLAILLLLGLGMRPDGSGSQSPVVVGKITITTKVSPMKKKSGAWDFGSQYPGGAFPQWTAGERAKFARVRI